MAAPAGYVPRYLQLYESGELERRTGQAVASLRRCRLCPWDCDVNRLDDETMVCRTRRYARVASYFPTSARRTARAAGTAAEPYSACYAT